MTISQKSLATTLDLTPAQNLFKAASLNVQSLIREILKEERDVMHLRRRDDIHQRIYDHVKRVIK